MHNLISFSFVSKRGRTRNDAFNANFPFQLFRDNISWLSQRLTTFSSALNYTKCCNLIFSLDGKFTIFDANWRSIMDVHVGKLLLFWLLNGLIYRMQISFWIDMGEWRFKENKIVEIGDLDKYFRMQRCQLSF